MRAAHVQSSLSTNFWDQPLSPAGPIDLTPIAAAASAATAAAAAAAGKGGAAARESAQTVGTSGERLCTLLPPARFLPFHVPMDIPPAALEGEGAAPLCELPRVSAAVAARTREIVMLRLKCDDDDDASAPRWCWWRT